MRLFLEERHEGIRVWCGGDLDWEGANALRRTLKTLHRHGRPVILDVGGILTADVPAAAALAHHVRRLREAGLPAALIAVDPDMRELLQLIGCEDVLGKDALDTSSGMF